jgi:DNA repair exonuclease SbcCD ATPase subunit
LECREVVEGTLRRLAQETGMRDESLVDALEHLHEMVGSLEEATRPDAEHGSVLHIRHAMTRTHQWATASPGAAFNAVVDQRARELTTTDARYAREAQRERERERDAAIEEVSRLKEQLAAAKDTDIYRQLVETRAAADREIEQARGEVARARAAADRDAQQARNDVARMRGSMKTLETEMRALEKQHARRLEAMEALEAKVEDLTRQVQTRRVEYVPVHGTVAGSEDAAPHSDPGDGDVSMRFALLEIER